MENKRNFGLAFFGVANVTIGLFFLMYFFLSFFIGVVVGLVTDRGFYGSLDWFCRVILDRFSFSVLYIFSFLLFWSGISMLRMKSYSRKVSMVASAVISSSFLVLLLTDIIRSYVYPQLELKFLSLWDAGLLLFFIFTISQIIYLNNPEIKKQFNDENVKLPLKIFALICIIFFLSPLFIQFMLNLYYLRAINK